MDETVQWLLKGPPWASYRTRVDLLEQPESDAEVRAARRAMIGHPQVQALLEELGGWPGTVISSHKSAGQPFHKLTFLADLGLRVGDAGVAQIAARVTDHASPEGPFRLPMNIPTAYGGTGQDQWAWALCDAPLSLYAVIKFGLGADARVQAALRHLTDLVRENGWPCAVSPELGKFRGPGRKDDPCPFANLAMLKALSQHEGWRDGAAAAVGAETLLSLWEHSKDRHPYMFFMGTDFRKLKAPFVWYDILHVADVLSQFPALRGDPRLRSMVEVIQAKADAQGRWAPESVWKAWQGWDFGQKKLPSPWLTFLVLRIQKRMEA